MKFLRLFWSNLLPNLEATVLRTLTVLIVALVPAVIIMLFWNMLVPEHQAAFWKVWMLLCILELLFRLPLRVDAPKSE